MSKYEELSIERKKLQKEGLIPEWYITPGYQMFKEKYEYEVGDKSVKGQFDRIAKTAARHLNKVGLEEIAYNKFFNLLWKGYLSPSTPVLANTGTSRGLPISCAGNVIEDSIDGFYSALRECAILSKLGFGTASYLGYIRPRGSKISVGGVAAGVVPVFKDFVTMTLNVSQGNCYIEGTEVLTNKGFVDFRYITKDTLLAQLDEFRNISFTKGEPTVAEYEGNLINFSSSVGLNLTVTPNHRMMVNRRKQQTVNKVKTKYWSNILEECSAEDIKFHRDVQLQVSGTTDNITCLQPHEKFMIAFQADGVKDVRFKNGLGRVHFNLKKDRKIKRLIEILEDCNFKYSTKLIQNGVTHFNCLVPKEYVKPTLDWVDLSEINGCLGESFIKEVSLWDGTNNKKNKSINYTSINKINIDILQAIASVSNIRTSTTKYDRGGNRSILYSIYFYDEYKPVQGESIEKNVEYYKGKVYCCIVPKGRIIVRDKNGFVSVCGNTRRGAWAGYLPIEHGDFDELVDYINSNPDGANIGWCISDDFINKLNNNSYEETRRYQRAMKLKMVTGKGYWFFTDRANRQVPETYVKHNLKVKAPQLCNEIVLFSDFEHTYSCVLSSMNLAKYDEWKNTDSVYWATIFLDCIVEEFLEKARNISGLEKIVKCTEKGRALGLGVCGLHTYMQENSIVFDSLDCQFTMIEMFKHIEEESKKASKYLANVLGEPEWCKGFNIRNTHTMTCPPTKSTSLLMAGVSEGINPNPSNTYVQETAAGEIDRINPSLVKLMKDRNKFTTEEISKIVDDEGSVQKVDWLNEYEKKVFKTAFEIDQSVLLRYAALRNKHVDQWQSVNLFIPSDSPEEYISELHEDMFNNENILGSYYIYSKSGYSHSNKIKTCEACQ